MAPIYTGDDTLGALVEMPSMSASNLLLESRDLRLLASTWALTTAVLVDREFLWELPAVLHQHLLEPV
jgi:hypothetical protein